MSEAARLTRDLTEPSRSRRRGSRARSSLCVPPALPLRRDGGGPAGRLAARAGVRRLRGPALLRGGQLRRGRALPRAQGAGRAGGRSRARQRLHPRARARRHPARLRAPGDRGGRAGLLHRRRGPRAQGAGVGREGAAPLAHARPPRRHGRRDGGGGGLRLKVVEDCAHAMCASWNGKAIGTFGAAAAFSAQTYKHLNAGEGGFLVLDDEAMAARAILHSGSYMLHGSISPRRAPRRWRPRASTCPTSACA